MGGEARRVAGAAKGDLGLGRRKAGVEELASAPVQLTPPNVLQGLVLPQCHLQPNAVRVDPLTQGYSQERNRKGWDCCA